MSGFMEAMYWSGLGVGKSARLTVQGINTGWFERHCWAGFCCRLTVQGINTGWFEPHGWTGRRCPLRRAVGGRLGRQVGLVAVEGDVDPADAEQGAAVAVLGARVGTIVAMDVAGVAHPDAAPGPLLGRAVGRAWAGAAPAMRSLPAGFTRGAAEFAVDRGGAAEAAGAGADATAGGECGGGGGRGGGGGGGGAPHGGGRGRGWGCREIFWWRAVGAARPPVGRARQW